MFNQNAYGQYSSSSSGNEPLAFYQGGSNYGGYSGQQSEGMGSMGSMGGGGYASGNMTGGRISTGGEGRWWEAFGTGGLEGEPSLMEELGIDPGHILQKSLTVLNPLGKVDTHIMDDADMAGPLVFCFAFAFVLLLSGKPQFSYIYGVGLLGTISIYTLLNLMSDSGIDAYRTASVLGYCLLPMVGLGGIGIGLGMDTAVGGILSIASVVWCTYAASTIFVAVLRMDRQRLLVAYPVGLFYGCFALLSIFQVAK
ncbi:hypothetical protein CspeluHIS016_0802580 [Cutaneotrichosporon spelunceum]|uniref:Protein YIP n=1 Tax=Cutaneotrichosporon spelunceum TaxID=1672016 RepID=A0AAD3U0A0_9TREE|nr:hypothetical protein CspeluHIS016_0802580 [Cutaneotrichosporon spelunceum]